MTNKEAIELLNRIAPMPRRGDGKSITQSLVMEAIVRAIKALEQQPKTGHWVAMGEGFTLYECSECGAVEFKKSKYCPNCGAKMEVEEE